MLYGIAIGLGIGAIIGWFICCLMTAASLASRQEALQQEFWDLLMRAKKESKSPEWLNQALNEGSGVYRP